MSKGISNRQYVTHPGGKGVRRIATEEGWSPTYVSTVLSQALRKIASHTLKEMGVPRTPERIDAVAFSPALHEILEEILCQPQP